VSATSHQQWGDGAFAAVFADHRVMAFLDWILNSH
jgi:hypothetical protein